MKQVLTLALGVLTAIGGFMDIGDLVTDALIGARFGLGMVWVTVVAVIGITVYSEMAGRVATITQRPVFDMVRERLGSRLGLLRSRLAGLRVVLGTSQGVADHAIAYGQYDQKPQNLTPT